MHVRRTVKRLALWVLLAPACLAAAGPGPTLTAHERAELRERALIDQSGHYAGVEYQTALRERAQRVTQQSSATAPDALSWSELGPGNVGGRLNAIWVNPANTQQLLAGSASGGLWKSNDGGTTWSDVGDFPGALTIGAIAELPNGTLLVGTGDEFTAGGDGMFSSSDGGVTWAPIYSTAPAASGSFWVMVNSIAVSSSGVALAATYGGIARSTDGQTWSVVWTGSNPNGPSSMDVVFDPENPEDAVADDESGGVVYSTDAGQSWSSGSGLPGTPAARVSLTFDPSVAGSVYALVDNNDATSPSGEVFHSTDGGASWTLIAGTGAFVNADTHNAVGALCDDAPSGTVHCQGNYDNVILAEPHSSGSQPTILVGGIDIFTSTDGGSSWSETGSWLNSEADYLHADQHVFAYVPSSGALYVGNDGGFYEQKTASSWSEQNEGLADIQFYGIAGHETATAANNPVNGTPITPIVAGAQDNGTLLYQGYAAGAVPHPDDWVPILGGDGGVTQVDPADGNDVFDESEYLSLGYSLQGGLNAQPYFTEPADTASQSANFIAPYVLVPAGGATANQMLAGGASLWLGTNIQTASPSWTAVNAGGMPAAAGNSNYISAIAVDPADANDVWVGYDDGELWHSTNALGGSASWSPSGAGLLPNRKVESLWIVPGQSSTVYATFGGYPAAGAGSNVWVTSNAGGTWTDVGSPLPQAPVYSLVTYPAAPEILYAGTLTGVYWSVNGGQNWSVVDAGPVNVEVRQLTWFDTSTATGPALLAATFGRGAWMGSLGDYPAPTLTLLSPAQVVVGSATAIVTLTGSGFVQGVSAVTLDGQAVSSTFVSATELQTNVPSTDLSAAGIYTFSVSNPAPGGGTSAGANLTVGNPAPLLISISPTSAAAGSSGVTIAVTGHDFEPDSTIDWNGSPLATSYGSGTDLTAALPAQELSSATRAQITVVTPSPGGGTSKGFTFRVTGPSGGGGGTLDDPALLLLLGVNLLARIRARARSHGRRH